MWEIAFRNFNKLTRHLIAEQWYFTFSSGKGKFDWKTTIIKTSKDSNWKCKYNLLDPYDKLWAFLGEQCSIISRGQEEHNQQSS